MCSVAGSVLLGTTGGGVGRRGMMERAGSVDVTGVEGYSNVGARLTVDGMGIRTIDRPSDGMRWEKTRAGEWHCLAEGVGVGVLG
jgi:hypothetical protein